MLHDPFYKMMLETFVKPQPEKGVTYTKTSIIEVDNKYRVSISKFVDGNHDNITVVKNTLEEAKKFLEDNSK